MELFLILGLGGAALLSVMFSDSDSADDTPEDETIRLDEGDRDILTGDGDDVIVSNVALDGPVTVNSGAGDDLIDIAHDGSGQSQISGGDGDDILRYDGSAALAGGAGNDILQTTGDSSGPMEGGDGDDYLSSEASYNTMLGGAGNDTIEVDTVYFGQYDGGDGDDTLILGFEPDYGDNPDDFITGGDGDDLFQITNTSVAVADGTPADDIPDYEYRLTGGEGADTFSVTHDIQLDAPTTSGEEIELSNSTWVHDFDPDEDVLVVTPDENGAFRGIPAMSVETSGPDETTGLYENQVVVIYSNDATGSTATWRLHVSATRALTEDDIVLNTAAA